MQSNKKSHNKHSFMKIISVFFNYNNNDDVLNLYLVFVDVGGQQTNYKMLLEI